MRLSTKVLIGAGTGALVLAILVVVGFANLTRIVRAVLEKQVPGLTFKALDVGWNHVSITGVSLERDKRTVFKVDSLRVRPSLASVFSDTLYIASIDIDGPYVYVVRNADGSLTLPVPEGMDKKDEPAGTGKKPPKKGEDQKQEEKDGSERRMGLYIERIRLRDGQGELLDRSVQGSPAKLTLSQLDVTVEKVAIPTGSEPIAFDVSMKLEGKRTGELATQGWYTPRTRSAEVALDLSNLFLPKAEPYYRSKQTTAVLNDGLLGLETVVEMKEGRYVAKNRLSLSAVAFAKEGLFLGVPVAVFRDYVKDQGKPFEVAVELEGSLDDPSKLQQQLVSAVVQAVLKEVGKKALSDMAESLEKGDVGAAKEQAGKALDSLFGR